MNTPTFSDEGQYEIQVKGHLDDSWASRFDGLSLTTGFTTDGIPITSLSGVIADQAALHGLLTIIRDMGLQLLSVKRLSPGEDDEGSLKPHEFQ